MNAFLITIDSLRADAVGYAGEHDVDTPNIDIFADRSLNYSNAFANAPYTVASFPVLLTGTYPWTYGGVSPLSSARPSLADQFLMEGYDTGGFHTNPYLDARFGYDRGFSMFRGSDQSMTQYSQIQQRIKELLPENSRSYRAVRGLKNLAERFVGDKIGLPYMPADTLTDNVVSWLDEAETPAFGWVHYMDVHNPYLPHNGCRGNEINHQRALKLHHRVIESPENLSPKDIADLKRLYLGEVEYLDKQIGRLLNAIDARWGLDETVVVLTSDHGEGFGEWGYYSHVVEELHDDLLRIPLIVHSPNGPKGTVDEPVSTVDVAPTLLSETGVSVPEPCVGQNIAVDETLPTDRLLFAHVGDRDDGKVAVGNRNWRLVRDTGTDRRELYRREGDYSEKTVSIDEHEPVADRLQSALDEHLRTVDQRQATTSEVEIDSEVEDRLERLGYK